MHVKQEESDTLHIKQGDVHCWQVTLSTDKVREGHWIRQENP